MRFSLSNLQELILALSIQIRVSFFVDDTACQKHAFLFFYPHHYSWFVWFAETVIVYKMDNP